MIAIKSTPALMHIQIVAAGADDPKFVRAVYKLNGNCFMRKPGELSEFAMDSGAHILHSNALIHIFHFVTPTIASIPARAVARMLLSWCAALRIERA
jgi:hypothetical protein